MNKKINGLIETEHLIDLGMNFKLMFIHFSTDANYQT
jgi:hypothetical protein